MVKNSNNKKFGKGILLAFAIFLTLSVAFVQGYSLGSHHIENKFLERFLPDFIFKERDSASETIRKTFLIKATVDGDEVYIPSIISFPHTWYFDEIILRNDEREYVLNSTKYVISSSDEKISLVITPRRVDNLRSVMAVTTVFNQEIQRRCLGSYDISESAETEFISLYRENIDNQNINYIQEVISVANPAEGPLALEEFIIFKRDGGFIADEEYIWTADISLEFDDSVTNEQKEAYLIIVDEIVSSLQIK